MTLIIGYHSIDGTAGDPLAVPPAVFRRQLSWLVRHLNLRPHTLDEARQAGWPADAVVITFDDGYADNISQAQPILEDFGIKPTVFVIPSLAGKTAVVGDAATARLMMTREQWREQSQLGWDIGSHTLTHANLSRLTANEARAELRTAKDEIKQAVGKPCPSICFPYNAVNALLLRLAREVGHQAAVATPAYFNWRAFLASDMLQPRVAVNGGSNEAFYYKLSPLHLSLMTKRLYLGAWAAWRKGSLEPLLRR